MAPALWCTIATFSSTIRPLLAIARADLTALKIIFYFLSGFLYYPSWDPAVLGTDMKDHDILSLALQLSALFGKSGRPRNFGLSVSGL